MHYPASFFVYFSMRQGTKNLAHLYTLKRVDLSVKANKTNYGQYLVLVDKAFLSQVLRVHDCTPLFRIIIIVPEMEFHVKATI